MPGRTINQTNYTPVVTARAIYSSRSNEMVRARVRIYVRVTQSAQGAGMLVFDAGSPRWVK